MSRPVWPSSVRSKRKSMSAESEIPKQGIRLLKDTRSWATRRQLSESCNRALMADFFPILTS